MNGNWLLLHLRHAGGMIIMAVLPALFLPVIREDILLWPDPLNIIQVLTLAVTGLILVTLVIKNRQ